MLTTKPLSRRCTKEHVPHSEMPLTMEHLLKLRGIISSETDDTLSHKVIYHHLSLTAMPPLIQRDRSLHITLNTTTYAMTPPYSTLDAPPHRLHLFLNWRGREPFLRHIHDIEGETTRHLELTTSLSSIVYPRQRLMMRTKSHAPDLITTLTFTREHPTTPALDYDSRYTLDPHSSNPLPNNAIMKHHPTHQHAK